MHLDKSWDHEAITDRISTSFNLCWVEKKVVMHPPEIYFYLVLLDWQKHVEND